MRNIILWTTIFLFCSIPIYSLGTSGDPQADGPPFVVRVKENRLTVKAKDIPLERVLGEIANQTLIEIVLYGPAGELVSADFSDLPLEKGLKRLTHNCNHVLIYKPGRANTAKLEIKAMLIFSKDRERSRESLESTVIVPQERAPQELGEASLDSVAQALQHKDAEVRENAVDRLAELKDERAAMLLGEVLLSDRDSDVRESAAEALGDLGGPKAVEPLIRALKDKDAGVRESAVESLATVGGDDAVRPLMDALTDEDEDVREAAALALKKITGENFTPQLQRRD
jgi:hypothetical protein